MDAIMVGPWMLCAEDALGPLGHGRYHCPTPGDSLVRLHQNQTVDDIMVGSWMLWAQNAVDHGHHRGCYVLTHTPRPALRKDAPLSAETVDLIMVGPWMRWGQNALDYGRHHGWLFSERNRLIRPCRCHGWAMDALFLPPQHSFQASAPVSKRQFLICGGF